MPADSRAQRFVKTSSAGKTQAKKMKRMEGHYSLHWATKIKDKLF